MSADEQSTVGHGFAAEAEPAAGTMCRVCGRYSHRFTWKQLHRLMRLTTDIGHELSGLSPRYNVAPTQDAPVVRQDAAGERSAAMLRWGLVPFWAHDPGIGSRLINARSEEVALKPAFRAAFKKRRCLVPVSSFYEWQAVPGEKRKQPWVIGVRGAELFALAGLWERWSREGTTLDSFTILTGRPNELVRPIHNRMPVIIRPEHYDLWLDPKREDHADFATMLEPFPADAMEAHRVGTRVNSPGNDDPSCIEPLEGQ